MNKPAVTRLRHISAKNPDKIELAVEALGTRIQIYGSPQWDGKRWVLWFVPSDVEGDIPSQDF